MSKIYTRSFRVRWSEMDVTGQVSPANYLRYLVETAYDWGDALGLNSQDYEKLGLFWLIRETEINLLKPLRHNEHFDFTIWMVSWQRVRGTRCFEIKKQDSGEIIAQGTQHIVSMDRASLRPTNMAEEVLENFRLENPRAFPYTRFPKISPAPKAFKVKRQVEWQDLDAQEHVNNAIFVTYAEEIAAQELSACGWSPARLSEVDLALQTRRVHIQYLSPAVWGETLAVATHSLRLESTGGSRFVGIQREDGTPVAECILDWKMLDRRTGQERELPTELLAELTQPLRQ